MNLRGIARLAAAAFTTTLLVGALGAPAFAAENTGAALNLEDPTTAADFATKGCEGIDDGKAVSGTDGWLFGKPAGEYKVTTYGLVYAKDDTMTTLYALLLDADGVHQLMLDAADLSKLKGAAPGNAIAAEAADDPPIVAPPAGVTGKLADGGGWIKTPATWLLLGGFADTDPEIVEGEFDLIRTCPSAATQPPASASAPASHPAGGSGGGQLPVTGTNVWILSGVGVALLLAGGLLFMAYRRRSVKFVA